MPDRWRVAELLGVLSLGTDLAMGQPADFARTSCVLALRIAEAAGFDDDEVRDVYDDAHLRYIGCNADTDLLAAMFGDELDLRRAIAPVDQAHQTEVLAVVLRAARRAAAGEGAIGVARSVARALTSGPRVEAGFLGHCEVGQSLATRLGFGPGVVRALGQLYGRWDGKGVPAVRGDDASPVAMCVALAQDALIHRRLAGVDAAMAVVRSRAGRAYRADLVEALRPSMLADLDAPPTWDEMIALEPGPPRWLEGAALDEAFAAIGDFTDIKSPWRLGHSAAVATLAAAAGRHGGLEVDEVRDLRYAGHVHDLGTIGVSAGTWGQAAPLSEAQWEAVRLHAYHSERILGRATGMGEVSALAGGHHERADASGYHRSSPRPRPAVQLLGAADAFAALVADRPHRARRSADEAATVLYDEAAAGRFDRDVVECVVAAATGTTPPGPGFGVALTERERQVLRLLTQGSATKQIGRTLGISPKTADKHIQQIYAKTGRRTRAGVTLFAMEHALV